MNLSEPSRELGKVLNIDIGCLAFIILENIVMGKVKLIYKFIEIHYRNVKRKKGIVWNGNVRVRMAKMINEYHVKCCMK